MMADEKRGITVKIDAALHAQVKAYVEAHGMTMAEFVSQALDDELHPKQQMGGTMENNRTIAFQVSEELYRQIKDYLNAHHMTQKEFMIGLIKQELQRDLTQTVAVSSTPAEEELDEDDPEQDDEELDEDDPEQDDEELDEDDPKQDDGELDVDDPEQDDELDEDDLEQDDEDYDEEDTESEAFSQSM